MISHLAILALLLSFVSAFKNVNPRIKYTSSTSRSGGLSELSESDLSAEVKYKSLAVSGFISKENNFAEGFVFSKLHSTGKFKEITTVTDSIKFARKRLMSPGLVYSGLFDVMDFREIETSAEKRVESLETALQGKEAWLSFNVTSAELPVYASIAAKVGLKRVVFAVNVQGEEKGEGVTFDEAVKTLEAANVVYTICKFGAVRKMGEAKYPYRIVRGALALPTEGQTLSSEDLMRVLTEVVDLPKSFNSVFGIGPGSTLDAEIGVYMKSQGWPERVQVGLLIGDFMEKLQVKYEEEIKKKAEIDGLPVPMMRAPKLEEIKEDNKYAGFFGN